MPEMQDLVADLVAEQKSLDEAIAAISDEAWETPSPAEGWLLRDCVAHLAEFDELAAFVVREGRWPPESLRVPGAALRDPDAELSNGQLWARSLAPAELIAWWRQARAGLAATLAPLDPKARLPWAG